ncbi:hypothetical protein PUN28_017680 [Cardiocondyla obscurior]|uniref:Uncharacterized protein n=1 Tax=Cardiocondyla obscurior TaxID=286306 RepID=A0AAW2EMW5_9HYME
MRSTPHRATSITTTAPFLSTLLNFAASDIANVFRRRWKHRKESKKKKRKKKKEQRRED